jgi:replicative DNA helicase
METGFAFPSDFDASFQRAVLRLMMLDEAFTLKAVEYLSPSFFASEALGWTFKTFATYFESYHRRMTEVPLREALRVLPMDRQLRYAGEVEMVILLGPVVEADWIKAQLADFTKKNVFAEAHKAAADLFNAGKRSDAYDAMAQAQDRIQQITFDRVDRSWFFEEIGDRQHARALRQMDFGSQPRSTGIRELDNLTEGGVKPSELWVVFAYAKRCKTTWLLNQGFHSCRMHQIPTLHIALEGKRHQVEDRYDACFSGELYTAVKKGEISQHLYAEMLAEYQRLKGLLVIRVMNEWDITVADIKAEIEQLAAQGFVPGTLIVDYMDLLRSRNKRVDSETQHQVDSARDLKRLINDLEVACWSAWQAQRPTKGAHEKEHILSSANVADAYAKVRIVDAWGSLNATDDEMKRNEMRVFWEGHRDAMVGKIWVIENEIARMRMLTSAREWIPPSPSEAAGV